MSTLSTVVQFTLTLHFYAEIALKIGPEDFEEGGEVIEDGPVDGLRVRGLSAADLNVCPGN